MEERELRGRRTFRVTICKLLACLMVLICVATLWMSASFSPPAEAQTLLTETAEAIQGRNVLEAGDFETDPAGWTSLWSREAGKIRLVVDESRRYTGKRSVRIEHTGENDWSLSLGKPLPVEPGQVWELKAALWVEGPGDAAICAIVRDRSGNVIDWTFGERSARSTEGWQVLSSRIVIPPGAATFLPRVIGRQASTTWVDSVSLMLVDVKRFPAPEELPQSLRLSGKDVEVELNGRTLALAIRDRRNGKVWETRALSAQATPIVLTEKPGEISGKLFHWRSELELAVHIRLTPDAPEVVVELDASGPMQDAVAFPGPIVTSAGQLLILPVNQGISYPVDDATLPPMDYHLYGGHGLCMAWWGVTDLTAGLMAIVETPDDAHVGIPRIDGLLTLAPRWVSQKGQFGYPRRLRFVVFDTGGYVAMCKRYRRYAQEIGLFCTLGQKRARNPHVDLLIGAVNVWNWDQDPVALCREMQELGIRRILWSNRARPQQIEALNQMGVLTSRYDIYQDVMDPANFPKLRGVHPDWPTEAWPQDIMLDARGNWVRGWQVRGKDDQWYPCGVLCDMRAIDYARKRILPELATHPYRCRFIDTTTASPWRECYHPDHPLTRSESKKWKMELLRFVSEECGLVTGSETGHDAAVPYVHYFEGMMSLGPYRVPDAGRNMLQIWEEVPERVAKFQTGHYYRLPLWELVYHDCVVAHWYWGDYNNKLPALWDRRDLWNALYGTPPMFMFTRQFWQANKERFVKSYQTATPVARATGYVEMTSHRWLTPDRAVQQTEFANGVRVTVNFGDQPYVMEDGYRLEPLGYRFEGIPPEAF